MANVFIREAIDGSDSGIWADKELAQNRGGQLGQTTEIFEFLSGIFLKIKVGRIGFDNGSNKGTIVVDTETTISIAGVSNSNWAIVEVSVSGTTPSFTATDISGATDPGTLPTDFTSNYDYTKYGFYLTSTKRVLGVIWVNASGIIEGVVNALPYVNGYSGYSITDDSRNHYYRWDKAVDNTYDANYVGRLYVIPEGSRSASWTLAGGSAVSWADVDFSAYVPTGVKCLLLSYILRWTGDGAYDRTAVQLRKNGATETSTSKLVRFECGTDNLAAGVGFGTGGQIMVLCDSDGVIEYQFLGSDATGSLWLVVLGYWQ